MFTPGTLCIRIIDFSQPIVDTLDVQYNEGKQKENQPYFAVQEELARPVSKIIYDSTFWPKYVQSNPKFHKFIEAAIQ